MIVFPFRRVTCLAAVVIGLVPLHSFAQSGDLGLGVSYSDRYGATGNIGVNLVDLLDGALDANLGYRAGDKGEDATANLAYTYELGTTVLGEQSVARFRIAGLASEWEVNSYDSRALDVSVGVGAAFNSQTSWLLNLVHNASRLDARRDDVASILVQDLGSSDATWLEAGLAFATTPEAGLFDRSLRVNTVLASTLSGDDGRNWYGASIAGEVVQPIGNDFAAALSIEGRAVAPQSGSDRIHVVDRYFANGRNPRGFVWGSAGPVDPVTEDPLGGTRQIAASAELRGPLPSDGLSFAVFLDAGSVWDLSGDSVAGLDDGYALRSSAGVAVRFATAVGQFEAAIARPISQEDTDIEQPFSVQFLTQF